MSVFDAIGQTATTALVNVRQGGPNTLAPVLRKLAAGTPLSIAAIVSGQSIQGNSQWYLTTDGAYVWSGGCAAVTGNAPASGASHGAASDGSTPNVVDLAHGDRVTSFADARAAGVIGIIHKATTGATGHDPLYADRRKAAQAAGLLWGAYHWGTAVPVSGQLDNFLKIAAPDASTLVALDFESDPGNQMTINDARQFLEGIETRLGRKAVLYSGNLIKQSLGDAVDPFFGSHRLWLCQYGNHPKVQASWSTFWLWQYTDGTAGPGPDTVPGLPGDAKGHLDCNHFLGSQDLLKQQWAS